MREGLVENWNNVVTPDDVVYILGDVVMGKRAENLPVLNDLNGYKVLILGNHDYPHPSNPSKIVDKWTQVYADYVDEMHLELDKLFEGRPFRLSHFPAKMIDHTDEVRYAEFRPQVPEDGYLIHGHLHCVDRVVADRHIHIGIDADWTDYDVPRYTPIPETAIGKLIKRVEVRQ